MEWLALLDSSSPEGMTQEIRTQYLRDGTHKNLTQS